jgi:hypothetical protein
MASSRSFPTATRITGNGVTFTPNVTPLYNLTDDDFIAGDGEDPVRVTRRPQSDVYNMVQVEFDNRAYDYNGDIAEAKDQNSIELYLLKPAPVIKAPFIKDAGSRAPRRPARPAAAGLHPEHLRVHAAGSGTCCSSRWTW